MPIFKSTHEQLIKDSLAKLNENLKDVGEDQDNMFDVVATTEDVDRDGETIMVDGWQTDNWFKNPVILSNHWYTVQNIVGKGLEFYKDEKGRMRLKGVFTEATEAGRICKALYNGGFLKAVSVGFIIKQRNEVDRLIIEKAELLEVSFVAVPCNPEALSQDGKLYKKGIELGIIKEVDQEDDEEDDGWNEDTKAVSRKEFVELSWKVDTIAKNLETLVKEKKDDPNDGVDGQDRKSQEEIVHNFFKNLSKNTADSLRQLNAQKRDKVEADK